MSKSIQLKPRLSEKSYKQSEALGTYVFDVPGSANKMTIKAAIEVQYDVSVTSVKTLVAKGKRKNSVRRGRRPIIGQRSDVKKAYVTLKEGDKLPIFAAIEEASAAEQGEKR